MPKWITPMMTARGSRLKRAIGNHTIVALIVAAAFVFARLDRRATAPMPDGAAEPSEPGGSGVITRSEVVRVWLPQTLIDVGQRELRGAVVPTHHELKVALERRRHEGLLYAVTIRGHQVNGGAGDVTFVRHPYSEPEHFQELLVVLAAVAANPSADLAAGGHRPIVHIVKANMSKQEFIEAVRKRHVR
jgi:hypothetical protein